MTTTSSSVATLGAGPTVLTVRWLLRRHLRFLRWAVGILLLLTGGAAVVMVAVTGTVGISVVQFARQGLTWFPFSIAAMIGTGIVAAHVAAGLTRRTLVGAALVVAVLVAAAYTAVMLTALLLERWLAGQIGWSARITESNALYTDAGQLGLVLLDHGLLFSAAQLSGLLVGVTYYRAGGWRATLALPLTAGPVLLVPLVLLGGPLGPLGPVAALPLAGRAVLCLGVLVLVAAAAALALSRAPVRPHG